MNRTRIALVIAALLALAIPMSAQAKYADVSLVFAKLDQSIKTFGVDAAKVRNANAAFTALEKLVVAMEQAQTEIYAFIEKYPELFEMDEPPAELNASFEALLASTETLYDSMEFLSDYMEDERIIGLFERMGESDMFGMSESIEDYEDYDYPD